MRWSLGLVSRAAVHRLLPSGEARLVRWSSGNERNAVQNTSAVACALLIESSLGLNTSSLSGCSVFHNSNLLLGQAVEIVHEPIDLPIGRGDSVLKERAGP